MSVPRVLIVDDDPQIRSLLRIITERSGLVTDEAADGHQCLEQLKRHSYDLVLLDLSMPGCNGFDVIEQLRSAADKPAVIVVTAMSRWVFSELDPEVVTCVIRKPFDTSSLSWVIVQVASGVFARRKPVTQVSLDAPYREIITRDVC
ncbi:MAG TPA: response regulator [Thermoanaerobaculia bacterium]|nr:response regulator [Thermoanaerobaculia bacterium]